MKINLEKFEGCLLGLALGDALGAPFEGGLVERLMWRLVGKTSDKKMRWTDDTQMSLNIAESLVANGVFDADDISKRFANSYRWSRGYGPAAAKLLKKIKNGADWRQANCSIYKEGSFGNGGAMRAPIIGLFYVNHPAELNEYARISASITHAHPLGIEGAVLIANTISLALKNSSPKEILQVVSTKCKLAPFVSRLDIAAKWLESGDDPSPKIVKQKLGNKISASESCVTAVYVALRFLDKPFLEMLSFIKNGGGDVDTISAMAGSIWGATNGVINLPKTQLENLEQRDHLYSVASDLFKKFPN